jgi:hypothetical protein
MIKIPMHSIIDLITNSSTEIFVHSEASLKPCKELITEFLFQTGSPYTCDDLFDVSIEVDKSSAQDYKDYYLEDIDSEEDLKKFDDYVNGKGKCPGFVEDYHLETYLVLKPKDPKYEKLAELFKRFLYSPEWYEHSSD